MTLNQKGQKMIYNDISYNGTRVELDDANLETLLRVIDENSVVDVHNLSDKGMYIFRKYVHTRKFKYTFDFKTIVFPTLKFLLFMSNKDSSIK